MHSAGRRLTALALTALALVAAPTPPAAADPSPFPYYRSQVIALAPAPGPAVTARTVFDDTIELTWAPGVALAVPGYQGEPYLRVAPDGTVEVNANSPAYYLNQDRYAQTAIPAAIAAAPPGSLPPAWEPIELPEGSRSIQFHDHRIHWMAPTLPPTIRTDGFVKGWEVPLEVDGQPVAISGELWVDLEGARAYGADFSRTRLVDDLDNPAPASGRVPTGLLVAAGASAALAGGMTLARWRSRRRGDHRGGGYGAVVSEAD